jgi:TonB family protein
VLRKAPKGDRLVGVHFDLEPEPFVDEPVAAPEPYSDPLIDARFASIEAAQTAPAVPTVEHETIDPILEAHFAGHVPVDVAPNSQVAVPVPVAPVPAPHAGETHVAVPLSVDAPPADVPAAHLDSDAPSARCESCGGPADGGDLCHACQHAFHPLLDSSLPAPAPDAFVPAREPAPAPAIAVAPEVPVAPPAPAPVAAEQIPPPVQANPVIKIKAAPPVPEPPAPAAAPPAEAAPARANAQRPVAPVAASSASPSALSSLVRTIGGAAGVVVVVAAIGFPLGKLWLGGQETSPIVRDPPPSAPVQQVAEPAATPRVVAATAPAAPARNEIAAQASPRVVPAMATLPKPAAPPAKAAAPAASRTPAARVPPKGSRPTTPLRPAAPVPAPSPAPVAAAPEVAAPAPVVAAAPKPEPPPTPVGPFFELRDVNETPRVATRVEPEVPDDLRDRQLNEVVIVRVLVTQSGHPSLVNLLRRSKAGPSLDSAIVAAVQQWTFVPARKRGEAVSCWFHVGVPVNRAN